MWIVYRKGNSIKLGSVLAVIVTLLVLFTSDVLAQNANSAAQTVENLRGQLLEVQSKEAELQARVKQLDEDLKPENIERYFAGVGSTRPEELRELRRSQLNREKASVLNQLEQLAARQARLESAILTAEAAAYQQSAQGTTTPADPMLIAQYKATPGWLVGALAGLIAILGLGALFVAIRRLKKT